MFGEFTMSEMSKYTEIPRRTLYRWRDDGLLPDYKTVEGQGPGQGDLYDKPVGVWAMFLDEASKTGVNFTGQGAGEVWLFKVDDEFKPDVPTQQHYDGPHLLGNSGHIVSYFRKNGFKFAAAIRSGKLGFVNKPSRDRFCEIRIVPLDVAFYSLPQYVDPRDPVPFQIGLVATHIVKSVVVISLYRLSNAFDYAVSLTR